MPKLHESNISNSREIIGYCLSIFATAIIFFSASMKIGGVHEIMESLYNINLKPYALFIGIMELVCVVLYWIPKTSNLGFFLLCSFVGGIIVAELVLGYSPFTGIAVGVMLYVGTFLRRPSLSGLNI